MGWSVLDLNIVLYLLSGRIDTAEPVSSSIWRGFPSISGVTQIILVPPLATLCSSKDANVSSLSLSFCTLCTPCPFFLLVLGLPAPVLHVLVSHNFYSTDL